MSELRELVSTQRLDKQINVIQTASMQREQ